jgi:hypothetical protein
MPTAAVVLCLFGLVAVILFIAWMGQRNAPHLVGWRRAEGIDYELHYNNGRVWVGYMVWRDSVNGHQSEFWAGEEMDRIVWLIDHGKLDHLKLKAESDE